MNNKIVEIHMINRAVLVNSKISMRFNHSSITNDSRNINFCVYFIELIINKENESISEFFLNQNYHKIYYC